LNLIQAFNIKSNHNKLYKTGHTNYIQAVNHLSYMSAKEFSSKFTGLLPLEDKDDTKPSIIRKLPSECKNLPVYKNWAREGKVAPVKSQKNCGASYLMAAVSALESAVAIEYGENVTELSTQWVHECVGNKTCAGGR
jgi:C1A family cysteine protease